MVEIAWGLAERHSVRDIVLSTRIRVLDWNRLGSYTVTSQRVAFGMEYILVVFEGKFSRGLSVSFL
jgi:hypothetical protein